MKKLLFVASCMIPLTASAQSVGCYVDFTNTTQCSTATNAITCSGAPLTDSGKYGVPVAELCRRLGNQAQSIQQLQTEKDQIADDEIFFEGQWSACNDTVEQIKGTIAYWEGWAYYYYGLADRLYKKCGSKCRKVR